MDIRRLRVVTLVSMALVTVRSIQAQEHFEALRIDREFAQHWAVGDLDDDGDLDIVARQGQFFVRWNDGFGRFTDGVPFSLSDPTLPTSSLGPILVVDTNHDGLNDLLAFLRVGSDTRIDSHVNLGGSFAPPISHLIPGVAFAPRVFRGDTDQYADAFIQVEVDGFTALAWLSGSPSGLVQPVFPLNGPFPTFAGHPNVATPDFDHDGDDDLVVRPSPSNGALHVFCNEGGQFIAMPLINFAAGLESGMTAGDVDGDGNTDLVVFHVDTSGPSLTATAFGDGAGGFVFDSPHVHQDGQLLVGTLADVDGDGRDDLVRYFRTCSVFRGRGDGTFGAPQACTHRFLFDNAVSIADLDADGGVDVVSVKGVVLLNGDIDGESRAWRVFGSVDVDWDRDGDIDVARITGIPPYSWAANDGRGLLTPQGTIPVIGSLGPGLTISGAFPIDFDSDGDLDLVVSIGQHSTHPVFGFPIVIYLEQRFFVNDRGARFSIGGLATGQAGQTIPETRQSGDFNGDGHVDIVSDSAIWLGDGSGVFTRQSVSPTWRLLTNGDVDADGDLDLLVARTFPGGIQLSALLFGPNLTVVEHPVSFYPSNMNLIPTWAWLQDTDGDLDLDVILHLFGFSLGGNFNSVVHIENRGFDLPIVHTLTQFLGTTYEFYCADTDRDGDVEVIFRYEDLNSGVVTRVIELAGPLVNLPSSVYFIDLPLTLVDVDGDLDVDLVSDQVIKNRSSRRLNGGGERLQYGEGVAGSEGFGPLLGCRGSLRPGENVDVIVSRAFGGTAGFLAVGLTGVIQPDVPLVGLATYVDNFVAGFFFTLGGVPGVPGFGESAFPAQIPPGLAGVTLFLQSALYDPSAPYGVSMTRGLALRIGQ